MPAYDGQIRVVGRTLRGWLANVSDAYERVPFELVIDGEERGYYIADRPFSSLEAHTAFGDGVHGFQLQLDRSWINGAGQTVLLTRDGVSTGVEIHAPLGAAPGVYFDDDNPPKPKFTKEEAARNRELNEMRLARLAARTSAERADWTAKYLARLDELSRVHTGSRHAHALARELYNEARYAEAVTAIERAIEADPNDFSALMAKGRALVAMNRAVEARAVFKHALALDPTDPGARFYVRTSEALSSGEAGAKSLTLGVAVVDGEGALMGRGPLAEQLAQLPFDWFRVAHTPRDRSHPGNAEAMLNAPLVLQAGCVAVSDDSEEIVYWRREALLGLAESGLIERLDGEGGPVRWRQILETDAPPRHSRKAALIVPASADREILAFMIGAAQKYEQFGYEAMLFQAGPNPDDDTIDDSATALRRFLLERQFDLIHTVSGLGYAVADALAFTNIPLIYGAHSSHDLFEEDDGTPTPRSAFGSILSRASMVYAGSQRMFDIVEQSFDVRLPIVNAEKEFA